MKTLLYGCIPIVFCWLLAGYSFAKVKEIDSESRAKAAWIAAGFTEETSPPDAWSLTYRYDPSYQTVADASLKIIQVLTPGEHLMIDWGDGSPLEFFTGTNASITANHTYGATGDYNVYFYACEYHITYIDIRHQGGIITLNTQNLTDLTDMYARGNVIRGTVDLSQCNLDQCDFAYNEKGYTGTISHGGYLNLLVGDVVYLQAYQSKLNGSLDLSQAISMEHLRVQKNELTEIIMPAGHANLIDIDANTNHLNMPLDLSDFPNMVEIQIQNNQLEEVDISNLPSLELFYAQENKLHGILDAGLSHNLINFWCYNNINHWPSGGVPTDSLAIQVGSVEDIRIYYSYVKGTLDLSTSFNLTETRLQYNGLTSLILPPPNTTLIRLIAHDNKLSHLHLDISDFTSMQGAWLYKNRLKGLDCTNLPALTDLRVQNNTLRGTLDTRDSDLDYLYAHNNEFTHDGNTYAGTLEVLLADVRMLRIYKSKVSEQIDLSDALSMEICRIQENLLTHVILPPPHGNLQDFIAYDNQIDTDPLDLSGFQNLRFVNVAKNELENLTIDNLPNLEELDASLNKLSGIWDFSVYPSLKLLDLAENNPGPGMSVTIVNNQLEFLDLGNCGLIGTLELGDAYHINHLRIPDNQITEVVLPGVAEKQGADLTYFNLGINAFEEPELTDALQRLSDYGGGTGSMAIGSNPAIPATPGSTLENLINGFISAGWSVQQ